MTEEKQTPGNGKKSKASWMQQLKLTTRIIMMLGFVFLIIITLNAVFISGLHEIQSRGESARDKSLVLAARAKAFQFNVIKVQQRLTDISATRGAERLDDGFDAAEASYQEGLAQLSAFEVQFRQENDAEMIAFIADIRESFEAFYSVGRLMARAYVDYGSVQGNLLMEKFNPYAKRIHSSVDSLITFQTEELHESLDTVIKMAYSKIAPPGIASVVLLTFLSLATIVLNRSINGPVNRLMTGLSALGAGDLTARVDMDTKDEFGTMARAFDEAYGKLQGVLKKILISFGQVENMATQISSSSEQLAAGAEEQQSQLGEVATTMEQMSAMILEASKNANETRQNAQLTGNTAGEGREVVSRTVTSFETVATTVEQAVKQFQELSKRSEEIGSVIQVIDDIADQTNLLALNANIEAARAGEAGRGFAVVADEVRKLAERTVSATAEIGKMIESIQGDIKAAVDSMEVIQRQSKDGLDLVGQSDRSLQKISEAIGQVVGAVEQIATASDEQSSGAEEISKNIEGVTTVAKESASSAQELVSSAEELNREVQCLNELINQFKVE